MEYNNNLLSEDNNNNNESSHMTSYVIDELLARRTRSGITYYKVKWKDGREPTWEPKENFINCELLFHLYEKKKNSHGKGNLKEDFPLRIVTRVPEKDRKTNLAFLVEWMERTNGVIPEKSIVYQSELKKFAPQILIKFYERCLIFKK